MIIKPFLNQKIFRLIKYCLIFLSIYFLFSTLFTLSKPLPKPRKKPKNVPNFTCFQNESSLNNFQLTIDHFHQNGNTDRKVLVILDSLFSRHGKLILQVLTAYKLPFKAEAIAKNLPVLTTAKHGRYSLIIIENYYKYLNMARWNRQLLDKYCKEYNVPVISFIGSKPNDNLKRIKIKASSLWMWQNQKISSLTTNKLSKINKIAKSGTVRNFDFEAADWVVFEESPNFEAVVEAKIKKGYNRAAVIYDKGKVDGVERILFGKNITDWTMKITFLDALSWAVGSLKTFSLDRFIQIDIDDIFVGAQNTRMVESDVEVLIKSQTKFRTAYIKNFTFTLGFSGSYFRNGDEAEDRGDEMLMEKAGNFVWFPHMWRHNHAHEHNLTYLEAIMTQNRLFAQNMQLPVKYPYAIAPQHDGVYPIHEEMYKAWKKIWNVSVTATEEYPHFKPATARKAFIYKNVSVLPRQTCGLYTHTQFFDTYPEGFEKMQKSIRGGDLFFTILLNPISIFMTHQQNYAHDRLAIYTFENLFKFLKCWTNLNLKWQNPIESAKLYFEKFPDEKMPIWTNPCDDPRHRAIMPSQMKCEKMTLPNLLILGPQKTGSTALANFLSLHPAILQNSQVPGSFEEVQFFGGKNYEKGIEWYMSFFQNSTIMFEKSATYFDNPLAAKEAAALLPNAKLVIILEDPSRRAYSWFQHLLAHKDKMAMKAGNLEVILEENEIQNLSEETIIGWKKIKQRCVSGGRYIHHLDKWLENYSLSQIYFVDSEELRNEPVQTMNKLVKWLGLDEFKFEDYLKFNVKKGFHCRLEEGKMKCLGESKGRKYEPMSEKLIKKLDQIFALDNSALFKFLRKNRILVPQWLQRKLNEKNGA